MNAPGADQTDYATLLQVGAPLATLLKLPSQRNEPTTYAVWALSATVPPSMDTPVGSVDGKVLKGGFMKLLVGGDGSIFERGARKRRTGTTFTCPRKFVI